MARTEQDLPGVWVALCFGISVLMLGGAFWSFLGGTPALTAGGPFGLVVVAAIFAVVFGFLVAAACGYMAGLVGSSSSPISGIAILATLSASLLLLALFAGGNVLSGSDGRGQAIALVLFVVSAVLATATISNDNLQDLKTGYLVGATPWRQQVALIAGSVVGALVIPPILNLLYNAYGFPGALPLGGMDPAQTLAAPQATLMARIATGILGGTLEWVYIYIGAALSVVLILIDMALRRTRTGASLPVLAVGIGLYLPPTVGVTLATGAILGWITECCLRGAPAADRAQRRGVLIASGFIVGESLVGVAMAAVIGASGSQAPLAVMGAGFAPVADWLTLVLFAGIAVWFARRVIRG